MLEDFFIPIVYVERRSRPDGMGGFIEEYVEGVEFKGGITTDQSINGRIAEQQGVKSVYTVTTRKNVPLKYGDILMRKSDNECFRVTSKDNDMSSPRISNLNMHQVTAESFTLPSI